MTNTSPTTNDDDVMTITIVYTCNGVWDTIPVDHQAMTNSDIIEWSNALFGMIVNTAVVTIADNNNNKFNFCNDCFYTMDNHC
jgi:hypothetical protein